MYRVNSQSITKYATCSASSANVISNVVSVNFVSTNFSSIGDTDNVFIGVASIALFTTSDVDVVAFSIFKHSKFPGLLIESEDIYGAGNTNIGISRALSFLGLCDLFFSYIVGETIEDTGEQIGVVNTRGVQLGGVDTHGAKFGAVLL